MELSLAKRATARKYIVNQNSFLQEDDISFYLLGAYMTDGCISDQKRHINFSISSKDEEWIENIKNNVCPTKPIWIDENCFVFAASDIDCINWLISYGCTPRKSKTLKIEKEIPKEYYRDFIRGVMDGDGSISTSLYKKIKNNKEYWYKKTSTYICSASLPFLEAIKLMVPDNINCNINTMARKDTFIKGKLVRSTCNVYRLTFNDSYAKKFLTWIYYPDNKLSMKRKFDSALLILK